jgi:hypothetical protein
MADGGALGCPRGQNECNKYFLFRFQSALLAQPVRGSLVVQESVSADGLWRSLGYDLEGEKSAVSIVFFDFDQRSWLSQ